MIGQRYRTKRETPVMVWWQFTDLPVNDDTDWVHARLPAGEVFEVFAVEPKVRKSAYCVVDRERELQDTLIPRGRQLRLFWFIRLPMSYWIEIKLDDLAASCERCDAEETPLRTAGRHEAGDAIPPPVTMTTMDFTHGPYRITVIDEPAYTPGSADNVRRYESASDVASDYRPSSGHGVLCRSDDGEVRSCIVLGYGGTTGVHEHSAVAIGDVCVVAAGDSIVALALPELTVRWRRQVDDFTCFGVHYAAAHSCLISHGEIEIARVELTGEITWRAGGKDIFSEGFRLVGDHVEAVDFNGEVYRFDLVTGVEPTSLG